MELVGLEIDEGLATVTLDRPKVNAINEQMVSELRAVFRELTMKPEVKAVVLTGRGGFFSFGFDIPAFMDYPKDSFHMFVTGFSELVQYIFSYPKPVVAALNGHTVAGGCILAIACDRRVMASGKAKIALNELTIGAGVFTSIAEILKFTTGARNAQRLLYSGKMSTAEEAFELGLVDEVCPAEGLNDAAIRSARELAGREGEAFRNIKTLLRKDVLDMIEKYEQGSVSDFVDIWYSEGTRKMLGKVEIRS